MNLQASSFFRDPLNITSASQVTRVARPPGPDGVWATS